MKNMTIAVLLITGLVFANPAFAGTTRISKSQLKECIYYFDQIEKKKGNIDRLGEVMEESAYKIDSYDYQLDGIEQQLSHTIGYKRTALIQEYNSLMNSRKKFYQVNKAAGDKRKKRIQQYRSFARKYENQCVNVSVSRTVLDEVCKGSRGFCGFFD